jgi:starch-binding outer membrane protein SusE/F
MKLFFQTYTSAAGVRPAFLQVRPLLYAALLGILLAYGCAKPKPQFYWSNGSYGDSVLTASQSSVTLTSANDSTQVITFGWPNANFGFPAAVTYTLQFDVPSDTSGTAAWGKATSVVLGTDVTTYSYLGVDLNSLCNALSMIPGTPDTLLVRIKSAALQDNGSASVIPPVFTNVVAVIVTPYALDLYVPGAYQNWNPATAPTIAPFSTAFSYVYEGYVYMAPAGLNYFKYTSAPDWVHINYGDGGNGTMSTNGAAAGLSVPDSGYYEVTANLNALTWTATKTDWGIIGDATPGGWTTDTKMIFNPTTQLWTVTCQMSASGSWKFRANGQWVIDFGVDGNGNLAYSDNPIYYNAATNNITVPTSGLYTITLNLTSSGHYTYSAQLN